jgi:HK97 family phage prohead protease
MKSESTMFVPFEFKAAADEAAMTFEGYGSVFNTIDSYGDTIAKGAFKATLREWKTSKRLPKLLLQHGGGGMFSQNADDMVPIGKWEEMREDDHGLFMRGRLFDVGTDRVKATYAAMKEGELDGLSIGFRTRKSKMDEETGIRTLTDVQLFEVSLVTFPANDPARVTEVRADTELPSVREFERWVRRDAGLTERQAEILISKGYRALRGGSVPSGESCEAFIAAARAAASILTGV